MRENNFFNILLLINFFKKLQNQQKRLDAKTDAEKKFADRLKDDNYVEKYARAKYYYSIDGENIYPAPNLLPK